MNQITTGSCGLVLDAESRSINSRGVTDRHLSSRNKNAESTGHFTLNRYRVDQDGQVCLSASLPLSELRDAIAVLTAELESLLEQAKQRFPETTQTQ